MTKDGGISWTIIDAGISTGYKSGFKEFCFTNDGDGIIVGNYGVILKSSNDGAIWNLQLNGTTNDLSGIEFTDINNGFAVGAAGTILRTTNSGSTWTTQPSGTSLHLNDVCFADENNGWIVGVSKFSNDWELTDSSIILHTSDGGMNWFQQISFVGTMQLFDLYFADDNNDISDFSDFPHGTYTAGASVSVGNNKVGVIGVCWSAKIIYILYR